MRSIITNKHRKLMRSELEKCCEINEQLNVCCMMPYGHRGLHRYELVKSGGKVWVVWPKAKS